MSAIFGSFVPTSEHFSGNHDGRTEAIYWALNFAFLPLFDHGAPLKTKNAWLTLKKLEDSKVWTLNWPE